MLDLTAKLLIELRNLVMMETIMITTDAQAFANSNVVMDLSLELKSAILEQEMPTQPTNANLTADLPDVVMVMLTSMKSVIMLPQGHLLLPVEITANSHTVVMLSLTQSTERNAIKDLPETQILLPLDVQLDALKTLVEPSDQQQLVILTVLWPVQDVSILMSVPPPDHHAVDLSNGWLPNPFKRFLNSKLINSNTSLELVLREANVVIANSLILTLYENVCVFLNKETSPLLSVPLAHQSQESPLFKPQLIFSEATLLKQLFFKLLSQLLFLLLSVNLLFSQHTMVDQPMLTISLLVKLKLSITEVSLILLKSLKS
jgi:hypothetical protein